MSSTPALYCRSDAERRQRVRKARKNGLDYIEVACEQTQLSVYFLRHAPHWEITPKHLRIDGGQRVRGIRVLDVHVERSGRDDIDDVMRVTVDRAGDFSTYKFCIVAVDPESGRPLDVPPEDFDPRYACVCFSFKASCPSDLDCATATSCEPPSLPQPAIDYLAKDYASFRRLILDRLALIMPDWKERHVPDLGITLVEVLAYVGDQLSYYQDAVATEAYLDTARLRISVRRHARLVDYLLHEGCNARTWMALTVSLPKVKLDPATFYFTTDDASLPGLVFEPLLSAGTSHIELHSAHNEMHFYTWNEAECCIPKGATSATLVDPGEGDQYRLELRRCDVLIFEEVLGPRTMVAGDADRTHRHAVRLTRVTQTKDPITGTLLVDIEWCEQDALPFALCISAVGPDCKLTSNVSVARGNVLLVDHGQSIEEELGTVGHLETTAPCPDDCTPAEIQQVPEKFRPRLRDVDVTHGGKIARHRRKHRDCEDHCATLAASLQLLQDCATALPHIHLVSTPRLLTGAAPVKYQWHVHRDLLDSGPNDRHFVVEVDDDRVAHLRFGDGECGRRPDAGETFRARYRVGNGIAGNVGAETIHRIVLRDGFPEGVEITARNPFPAQGGTAPELVAEAKLRAPFVLRRRLARAITADDYASIVRRDFPSEVQRAAATFRHGGAGTEVLVAIDPVSAGEPRKSLLQRIARHLDDYRRIGHDVHVMPARYVPVDVAITVCIKDNYVRGHVRAAVLGALSSRRLANGKLGFFHPDNLTFGQGVHTSRLVATVQSIEGVESVVVTRLERLDAGPQGELAEGVLPIGAMEVARLDANPNFPENGVLTLTMRGGR